MSTVVDARKKRTLVGIYIGVVGSIMISSAFSTLLPAAALEIGGTEIYPLAASLSGIFAVILMPLYGFLAARNPALKPKLFCFSMAIGVAVLLVRALAPNMWLIVIPGALYGFVSPAIFVVGFSLIRELFETQKVGVYLGIVGTMTSIGMLLGPLLTGLIIDALSWRVVCHICWPILLLALLLVNRGFQMSAAEAAHQATQKGSFDYAGAAALVLFLAPLALVLSLGASFVPFGSVLNTALIVMAVLGLAALIFIIRLKGNAAIVPAPVLKDRNVLCLAVGNLLFNFSQMAIFFFMPTYVLYVIGGSATEASLTTTMLSICGLFLGPFLGKQIGKTGNARNVLIGGTLIRIAATAALFFLLKPSTSLWLIYALMLICGIYNSQQSVTYATAPQIQIKAELRVLGNSVVQVMQSLGANIGTAVFTLVIGVYGVADGMPVALMIALVTAVLGLLVSLPLRKLAEAAGS